MRAEEDRIGDLDVSRGSPLEDVERDRLRPGGCDLISLSFLSFSLCFLSLSSFSFFSSASLLAFSAGLSKDDSDLRGQLPGAVVEGGANGAPGGLVRAEKGSAGPPLKLPSPPKGVAEAPNLEKGDRGSEIEKI